MREIFLWLDANFIKPVPDKLINYYDKYDDSDGYWTEEQTFQVNAIENGKELREIDWYVDGAIDLSTEKGAIKHLKERKKYEADEMFSDLPQYDVYESSLDIYDYIEETTVSATLMNERSCWNERRNRRERSVEK